MSAADNRECEGRVALVTGASRGIGAAIAERLAEAGGKVAVTARTLEPVDRYEGSLSETVDRIRSAGGEVVPIQADISKPDERRRMVDETVAAFGPIDILVNNAGIIRRNNAIDFTEADWDAVLDVNLKSVFFLSQAAARHMIPNGGGKIINIASMLSFQGGIRVPSYTASKSGVAGLTRLLANEWAASGINVNAIAPGYFATNNTAALQADAKRNSEILGRIPAGRWGNPEDLGGAAVFLASSAANYVQGIILPVDGGWLAR